MRSSEPIPGEPWPHDMVITVDDQPGSLLDLLWVREAHQLQPGGDDLPPLLSETPLVVRDSAVDAETHAAWAEAWPRVWDAAAAHAGEERDPGLFEEIQRTVVGSTERADLLHRIVGPNWRDLFGDTAFNGASYRTWSDAAAHTQLVALPARLEDSPERRSLPGLIRAWEAGLTKIVSIPCRGEFTRTVGRTGLLLTNTTREDSDGYQRALRTFI